jgi:KUP system potassium uptake protein
VLAFRESAKLADAYGLAVTLTMLTTTIAYAALTRRWRWTWWQTAAVTLFFLCFDGSFLIGNVPKIPTGGWIPLAIAIAVFSMFVTWYRGRRRQARTLQSMIVPVEDFLKELDALPPVEAIGTAIFLTAHPHGVPYVMSHSWLRTHVTYEKVVLLTIIYERRPRVPHKERVAVEELRKGRLYRVTAHYGFMENPTSKEILRLCGTHGPEFNFEDATFFVGDATIVQSPERHRMQKWARLLFAWMLTNSRPIESVLDIPPDRIVRVGLAVPV